MINVDELRQREDVIQVDEYIIRTTLCKNYTDIAKAAQAASEQVILKLAESATWIPYNPKDWEYVETEQESSRYVEWTTIDKNGNLWSKRPEGGEQKRNEVEEEIVDGEITQETYSDAIPPGLLALYSGEYDGTLRLGLFGDVVGWTHVRSQGCDCCSEPYECYAIGIPNVDILKGENNG